jgi:hypothetical protein
VAHPGGLNAEACHNNRKTGDYHCHRTPLKAASAAQAGAPAAAPASSERVIKKSQTGICHAPGRTYYAQTRRFTSYATMEACLASGGRLPRR